jgi:hypothetical protein
MISLDMRTLITATAIIYFVCFLATLLVWSQAHRRFDWIRIPELFEPFTRLLTHQEHTKGLGPGLVVYKKLFEAHSGRIWVELN